MSEYQRYEFMTVERPLTPVQLDAVNALSSHIKASSTQALIEYNWGDFKHDPIKVLHKFFDGLLYWANWGNPRLALRFPHGILSARLIEGYDFDDFVTFTQHADYDILDTPHCTPKAKQSASNWNAGRGKSKKRRVCAICKTSTITGIHTGSELSRVQSVVLTLAMTKR